jgi:hypothetical protein
MHSLNEANFAILYWFGLRFEPRFTNFDDQLLELYGIDNPALYGKCLIQPIGQIGRQLITSEKPNIGQIVATLCIEEDHAGIADPQTMHVLAGKPDTSRYLRVRQAHPQYQHIALPVRAAARATRASLAKSPRGNTDSGRYAPNHRLNFGAPVVERPSKTPVLPVAFDEKTYHCILVSSWHNPSLAGSAMCSLADHRGRRPSARVELWWASVRRTSGC